MEIHSVQSGPLQVNAYIAPLAGRAVLLVDPGACEYSGDEKALTAFLDERDCVPVGVLLTHGHFDHVCGLKEIRRSFPKIPIAIHAADKAFLGKGSDALHRRSLALMGLDDGDFMKEFEGLPEADVLLGDGDLLDEAFTAEDILSAFTGDEVPDVEAVSNALCHWRVVHTPGHTEGSACFYNESEKVLLSGDTIFYQSYGRTDLFGGSEEKMQKSLSRIFTEIPGDVLVYPGHGSLGFELSLNE